MVNLTSTSNLATGSGPVAAGPAAPKAAWLDGANEATRELLHLTQRPEVISLAGGLPAPEIFPVEAVAEAFARAARENPAASLQYAPSEGVEPLRRFIAERYRAQGAVNVAAENIIITTGSQQGLSLLGQALINPGDKIAVDEPSFLGAFDAWRPMYPSFTGLSWDRDTPFLPKEQEQEQEQDVEGASSGGKERAPIFAYCLPNFRNPTGESMTEVQRRNLVSLAQDKDMFLLEDDPYSALRYEGVQPVSLLALASESGNEVYDGCVIAHGTVSKSLAPALRVGWMVLPKRLVDAVAIAKQGMDLCTSPLNQFAALDLIASGLEEQTAEKARVLYKERRDAMLEALERFMPSTVSWNKPDGGMFIWLNLPSSLHCDELFQRAVANNVAFVPGNVFYIRDPNPHTLRLNFTGVAPEKIEEGVRRLSVTVTEMLREAA